MSSFGRKGLAAEGLAPAERRSFGNAAPRAVTPSRRMQFSPQDDLDARREEFIASERARQEREGGGISDVAAAFKGLSGTIRFERNVTTAYVLWLLLGTLSAHRFYLGAYKTGLVQLLVGTFAWMLVAAADLAGVTTFSPAGIAALALCGTWLVADLFLIPRIFAKLCRGSGESPFASA